MPNLMLVKQYEHTCGDRRKISLLASSLSTWHETIGYLWLPISDPC